VNATDRQVLDAFSRRVRAVFPSARIWAFGSRVRGDATAASDLDVCIVLDALDEDMDRQLMRMAWEVGFAHDILVSTVTFSLEDFRNGPCSESPLVRAILKEGVAA
jgi:uncharacterized protein